MPTPLIAIDINGQPWSVIVNPDGSITTTTVTATAVTPPPANSRYAATLQSVVNLAATHNDLMPLANVGGFVQEPALSLANDTIQELLAAPYDWKFNRKSAGLLVTQPSRQDYLYGGATAFVPGFGGVSIGLASGNAVTQNNGSSVVQVACMQPHNFSVGQTVYMLGNTNGGYNSTLVQTTTTSTWTGGWVVTAIVDAFTFQLDYGFSISSSIATGAAGIFDYGWLEHASMYDVSSTDALPLQHELTAVKHLRRSGNSGFPTKICVLSQLNGVLTLRLNAAPTSPGFGITPSYQMAAPIKTDLTNNWAPFPDEFGFVYRQAFLARCYRFLGKPQAQVELQRSEAMIMKALGKDDSEDSDQYVSPENSLMGGGIW